jgi:hypothetical protein
MDLEMVEKLEVSLGKLRKLFEFLGSVFIFAGQNHFPLKRYKIRPSGTQGRAIRTANQMGWSVHHPPEDIDITAGLA